MRVCYVSEQNRTEEQEGGVHSQLLQCLQMVYDTAVLVACANTPHRPPNTHQPLRGKREM